MKFYGVNSRGKFWVHRVTNVNNETHNGEVDEGRFLYNKADEHLYVGDESKWIKITTPYDVFQVGTKLLFGSYPLPTNWNIDTTFYDFMPITTNASGSVATSGGSWTISGMQADGDHTHGGRTAGPTSNSSSIGRSDIYAYGSGTSHTHSITRDGEHQHTFDPLLWRPAYVVVVIGTYT